jgi:hypothetical protein
MQPAPPAHLPGSPPPRERVRDVLRRAVRSRDALVGVRHWLLVRGSVLLTGFVLLYVANGLVIGWPNAYDVALGIQSPGKTTTAWLAWPLSLAGWLAMPAVTGAVAGYVLTVGIAARRSKTIEQKLAERDG